MKKILSTTAAAVMLASGFVALSGETSTAGEPGYPGSVDTTCFAEALNNPRVGNAAKASFRVGTGGNGEADGIVNFTYERTKNGVVTEEFTRQYNGSQGKVKFAFDGIPRGKYVVRVFFNSKPVDSVYQNCRTNFEQQIRPRR